MQRRSYGAQDQSCSLKVASNQLIDFHVLAGHCIKVCLLYNKTAVSIETATSVL